MIRKLAVLLFATAALLVGSASAASAANPQPDFRAQALAAGLTEAQATSVQQRLDAVLAWQPGGRQVSATQVKFDGLTVTADPYQTAALNCAYGHLCMTVRGTNFDFYTCRTWYVTNWWGTGPYINNQTTGTIAKFYGQSGNELWRSKAYDEGTANWTPVWSLRPC